MLLPGFKILCYKKIALLAFATLWLCMPLWAVLENEKQLVNNKSVGFTKNKGQIIDQHNKPNPAVLYLLNGNGLNVQIRKTGFSYDIFTTQRKTKAVLGLVEPTEKLPGKDFEPDEVTYNFHRIDVELAGANPNPQIIAEGKSSNYTNYYNVAHAPDGILEVHQYQKVIFKDIYPGIDIEYLLNEKGFKYNFVVHAGANLAAIKLRYNGAPFITSGQILNFKTSLGDFKESIPASWLIKNGLNLPVQVDYTLLDKETIGFKTKTDYTNLDLVVDPNPFREWGTYYGGNGEDFGNATAIDLSNNIYIGGYTASNNNIATSGTFQSSYINNGDAFLAKFNSNGVRLWGTYYGGNAFDFGQSICTDGGGNIYLAGYARTAINIAFGNHQTTNAGELDAILVKFNTNGMRQWDTYYGGTLNDYGRSVCTDNFGNVFLVGQTGSTTNIATIGSHSTTFNGGTWDAFVVKFNTQGVRLWGTYYGGSQNEIFYSVCSDALGNIYAAGTTNSTNNIATPGSHMSNYLNNTDAFLVKFNTNGVRNWGTYYGGNSAEIAYAICTDASWNIYLAGETRSIDNISTPGSHQVSFGGGDFDAFLVKFNTNGVRQWSTYYGGNQNDFGFAVLANAFGNIYLVGQTASTNNIATAGSHQVIFGGIRDAFIAKFNTNGLNQWGTYIGGSNEDIGHSICIDASESFYIAGRTSSTTSIASSGSNQTTFGGVNDAFLTKFSDCNIAGPLGNIGNINNPANTYCQNTEYTFTLSAPTANAAGYRWIVPLGWTIVSGQNTTSITVKPISSGTISVKAYNNCADSTISASRTINVNITPPQPSAITTTNGQLLNGTRTLCNGSNATFTVSNISGVSYNWTFPADWTGSGSSNTTTRTVGITRDTISVVAVNTAGCASVAQKLYVDVFQTPNPGLIQGPSEACISKVNNYFVDSVPFATNYNWTVPASWTVVSGLNTRNILVNADSLNGNITLTTDNFCGISQQRILAVTSANIPAQPGSISGKNNVCAGEENLSYSVANVNGVRYRWVLPANWQLVSGNNTHQITVNVPTNAVSGTIQVFPSNALNTACEGLPSSLNILVSANAFGPLSNINGNANVCAEATATYSISNVIGATSYVWTLPQGWSGTSNSNSIQATVGSIAGKFEVNVRAVNGTCSSAVMKMPVTVHAKVNQPANITGSDSICANSTQSFGVPIVPNALGYIWNLPGNWRFKDSSNGNSVNLIIGNTSGSFNLSVQAVNGSCTSLVSTKNILVKEAPQAPNAITGSQNVCEGSTYTFSTFNTQATSYTWLLPNGWMGNSTIDSIVITFNANSDTLRVIANGDNGCSSLPQKLYIRFEPKPVSPIISGATQACISQFETYLVNKINNVTSYIWTIPNGWTMDPGNGITTDTMILIRPNNGALGTISVKGISDNGCIGNEGVLSITGISSIIPSPPLAILGTNAFCVGIEKTFSVQQVSGATGYVWQVPSGWAIMSGQGSNTINVLPNENTGTIQVQTLQGGCKSATNSFIINNKVNKPAKPISITPSVQPACEFTLISLSSNNITGASAYVWQLPNNWTFVSDSTQSFVVVQVGSNSGMVTVSGKNEGCISDSSLSLNILVNKKPEFIGGIMGQNIVKANLAINYSVNEILNATYKWSVPSGWTILNGQGTNSITTLTGASSGLVEIEATNTCGTVKTDLNVISDANASINNLFTFKNLAIYPIPASNLFTISYELSKPENIHYKLVSLTGQLLMQGNLNDVKGEETLNITNLAEGMYMLQFFNNNQQHIYTQKVQVIK